MAIRDAAPLLSLLGHELRAPAGVIGGYVTLIERAAERLTPEQHQALAGARRAQQRLVAILDEASRLVATWKADEGAPVILALDAVLDDVRGAAASEGIALATTSLAGAAIRVNAVRTALADAIVAVAGAVAREHGVEARITAARTEGNTVTCRIRASDVAADADAAEVVHAPFQQFRPGLGLRLVLAGTVLTGAGAVLQEVVAGGTRAGVDITFAAAD